MRAFLAIPVLPPASEALHLWHERVAAEVDAVRWAPADGAHITLHFFGQISEAEAGRALRRLGPVFAAEAPIRVRLSGLGWFPSRGEPRVLWCGVDGEVARLGALAGRCWAALEAAGFPVERRAFRPHCTLGRPRRQWPAQSRRRWLELAGERPTTPAFTADRALLYESITAPEGVRHVPRHPLVFGLRTAPGEATGMAETRTLPP